jgi:hypothetical protein
MKGANSDLANSAKPAPPPAIKADLKDSSPKQSAEDVAETIFAALKNNNSPAPNHGLQVVSPQSGSAMVCPMLRSCAIDQRSQVTLENSSPLNPVKSQSFERFTQIMEQGKYSILLGKFDKFIVSSAQPGAGDGPAQISLVDVKVRRRHARTRKFDRLSRWSIPSSSLSRPIIPSSSRCSTVLPRHHSIYKCSIARPPPSIPRPLRAQLTPRRARRRSRRGRRRSSGATCRTATSSSPTADGAAQSPSASRRERRENHPPTSPHFPPLPSTRGISHVRCSRVISRPCRGPANITPPPHSELHSHLPPAPSKHISISHCFLHSRYRCPHRARGG